VARLGISLVIGRISEVRTEEERCHCPRLGADNQDLPAVHELFENVPHDVKIEQVWIGEGSLTLPVCKGEEISDLAPIRCGKGIRASMADVVDDLKTLKESNR
jgi:hypothetical protein